MADAKGQCASHAELERRQTELLNMVTQTQAAVSSMGDRVDRIEASQDKLTDKVDAVGTQVTELRTALPHMLAGVVDKTTENMKETVKGCRTLQDAENKNKFIGLPEVLQNNLLKLVALGLLALLGLDGAGVINVKPRVSDATPAGISATSNPHITVTTPISIDKK